MLLERHSTRVFQCCAPLLSCDLHFPLLDHQEVDGAHVDGICGAPGDFPRGQDWEPVLLAAQTRLDEFAATTQDCSVLDGGLPMRCANVTALFDDLVGILWEIAASLHPRPSNFPRQRRQPRWLTDDCLQAMVVRKCFVERQPKIQFEWKQCSFFIPSSPLPQAASFLEVLARRGCPVAHPGPPSRRKPHSQVLPRCNHRTRPT